MRTPWLLLIGLVGCALTEDPDTSTVVSADTIGDPCETRPFACGNSGGYLQGGMHELSLLGDLNTQNLRLQQDTSGRPQFWKDGVAYWLEITDGEIIAHSYTSRDVLQGANTKGGELHIVNDHGGPAFDIVVKSYRRITYTMGDKNPLNLYVMWYRPPGGALKGNACNPAKWMPRGEPDPFYPMHEDELLMFSGDRFDPTQFTVRPNPADAVGWITFGCAGHALAKLDLANQTRHRELLNGYDDWAGRQATFKMYAADYCGPDLPMGATRSYTVAGMPLLWKGPLDGYVISPLPPSSDLEARWDENGAKCIKRARLEAHPHETFPGFTAASLWGVCASHALPCSDTDPTHFVGARRVSANYFP